MISLKSAIAQKLLDYFFLNPEACLYVNELARKLNLDKRNLVKKIKELEEAGLLQAGQRGNLKLYSLNSKFPLYEEYRRIVLKTIGLEAQLRQIISLFPAIERAILFGSYARDKLETHSDIDLLVVGNHDMTKLQQKISGLQKLLDRIINVVNMSPAEFNKRKKNKDPFLANVLKNKRIVLK